MPIRVTDHAILRYLERERGLALEELREQLRLKVERAAIAAQSIGGGTYYVIADGVKYRLVNDAVVTVVTGDRARDHVD